MNARFHRPCRSWSGALILLLLSVVSCDDATSGPKDATDSQDLQEMADDLDLISDDQADLVAPPDTTLELPPDLHDVPDLPPTDTAPDLADLGDLALDVVPDLPGDQSGDTEPDGIEPEPWSWCPPGDAAIFDPTWPYAATVSDALYCAYAGHGDLLDTFRNAAQLRLLPGDYRLPLEEGSFPMLIPACALRRDGLPSQLAGAGSLDVSAFVFSSATYWALTLNQALEISGLPFVLSLSVSIYDQSASGTPLPELTIPPQTVFGEAEVFMALCPGEDCSGAGGVLYPCAAPGSGQEVTIAFDRGSLTVFTYIFAGMGPSVPAALTRAHGTLDGVDFSQDAYFSLAHRPDHHNLGGGFLVHFDEPVAGACAILAEIPSPDGSFWISEPGAWLLDCDLNVIETLSGVRGGGGHGSDS